MSIKVFAEKSTDELKKELMHLLKEQFSLRMQKGMPESAPRPHAFKKVRRNIARVLTVLREREIKNDS